MNDPRAGRLRHRPLPSRRSCGRRGWSSIIPTATSRRCAASRWRSRRASSWRSPGPAAAARARCCTCSAASTGPTRARSTSAASPSSRLDLDAFHARQVGFVFQSFYLMPTLTAVENVQVPMFEGPWPRSERAARAGRSARRGRPGAPERPPAHASSPSASGSGSPSPGRWPTTPNCSWPTSRPATSTARARTRSSTCSASSASRRRITLVIVTHSHDVARAADRRIAMKDGRVVGSE